MRFRLIFLVLMLCAACRSGEIPCPKVKGVKLRKTPFNWRIQQSTVSAKKEEAKKEKARVKRSGDERMVSAISVEDWDCPRANTKKYMPRSVKENIRKNMKKIRDPEKDAKKQETDAPSAETPSSTH